MPPRQSIRHALANQLGLPKKQLSLLSQKLSYAKNCSWKVLLVKNMRLYMGLGMVPLDSVRKSAQFAHANASRGAILKMFISPQSNRALFSFGRAEGPAS